MALKVRRACGVVRRIVAAGGIQSNLRLRAATNIRAAQRLAMNPELTPDQSAAHQFLSELRTRITTQPLPYQHGTETRALTSLHEVFGQAREAMKSNPGCEVFAREVTEMLNVHLRPFTDRWHKAREEGRLDSMDGGDAFRGELETVRAHLRKAAVRLHGMAYGQPAEDRETPMPMLEQDLDALLRPLPFGVGGELIQAHADEIKAIEAKEVAARRKNHGVKTEPDMDAVGLAFSGGGIRSATFCLGVAQVLADKGLLKQVDFLSTVSGGGYTGSFLTARMGSGTPERELAAPDGPDTRPVRELRQRAKYLAAYSLWESWGMVTATLAGMFLNWTIPLVLLLIFAAAAVEMGLPLSGTGPWALFMGISSGLTVIAALTYFCLLRGKTSAALAAGWCFTGLTLITAAFGAGWTLDAGFDAIFGAQHSWPLLGDMWNDMWNRGGGWGMGAAGAGGLAALVPVVLRFVPLLKTPSIRKLVIKIALLVAGFAIPLLGIAVFYLLCAVGSVGDVLPGRLVLPGACFLWLATGLLILVAILVLNINLTGPHRLYRNGLNKTFVQKSEDKDERLDLTAINPDSTAPYHLINAAVNLPTSRRPGLRDRHCDFFLFSKHWTGSPGTGYRPTGEWKMNNKAADLGSAMSISGAAFSANMGVGSMPTLRALLAFLNVRLGFWIRRPDGPAFWKFPQWQHPGFFCLLREMSGIGMAEHHRWLNLSDGGHIENMAVYELLRRRCKFIICVDGEADPTCTFQGLMTLVRHAQIDFGIVMVPQLDGIRPAANTGFSRSHFHLCRIHYPEGTGLLLYLKLSVTGNESELIRRYRANHPAFPHETTLDQFFDQEQFEAYRQLGAHVAHGMFSHALMNNQAPPATIPDWFRRLAENLLEPNAP